MPKAPWLLALMFALSSCLLDSHGRSERLDGRWEGVADLASTPTKAIVDFVRGADGVLGASISVPDERLLSKPLVNVHYRSPRVHFELRTSDRAIAFDGTRKGNIITGSVRGGDTEASLRLERVGEVPRAPYTQEEVRFPNGGVSLSGTLLLPPGQAHHPAVILIHGSSTPNRNDFRFYGDLFARRGIAALIYDKRNEGSDRDGISRVDLRDLAGDALGAVEMLKGRADINPRQIGLWGHSQGGWVAPIAAAQSKDVAFVISFSGPGVTFAEVNKYADATRLRRHGFSDAEIGEETQALDKVDQYVRSGGDKRLLQAFLDTAWSARWASQSTLPRRVPSEAEIQSWLRWRDLDLDPARFWEQVGVPVLALFGELDDVVPVQASVTKIESALRRGGNKDVTVKVYPKASHTIQPAPDFLSDMVDWLLQRVTV